MEIKSAARQYRLARCGFLLGDYLFRWAEIIQGAMRHSACEKLRRALFI
jgi:hypothetical protein